MRGNVQRKCINCVNFYPSQYFNEDEPGYLAFSVCIRSNLPISLETYPGWLEAVLRKRCGATRRYFKSRNNN